MHPAWGTGLSPAADRTATSTSGPTAATRDPICGTALSFVRRSSLLGHLPARPPSSLPGLCGGLHEGSFCSPGVWT